jgi:hypothetical protein
VPTRVGPFVAQFGSVAPPQVPPEYVTLTLRPGGAVVTVTGNGNPV